MNLTYLMTAAAALAVAGTAQAAVPIPTIVTASGSYLGNLANINDGIFPADGTNYQIGTVYNFSGNTVFTFTFDGPQTVAGFKLNVDHNDHYTVILWNGAASAGGAVYSSDGIISSGTETFASDPSYGGRYVPRLAFPPFTATHATIQASGGDSYYGIGEVQFYAPAASPSGVPEPATWGMMLLGFAGLGGAMRRGHQARVRYPVIA